MSILLHSAVLLKSSPIRSQYRAANEWGEELETHMIGSSSMWREREHGENVGLIRNLRSLWHQWALGSHRAANERG